MTQWPIDTAPLGRRAFLQGSALVLTAAGRHALAVRTLWGNEPAPGALRIGLVTDLHHADKPPTGSRYYRQTLDKLVEAAEHWRDDPPALYVELGDFIDAAESVEVEQRYLQRIQREFAALGTDRHYVLGNHCVDTLTKEEFLDGVEQPRSYYSFDRGGYHFVVLDSCFRSEGEPYGRKNFNWTDPNIPPEETEWLADDLQQGDTPTIVFAHQRLDVSNHYGVKNAEQIRRLLESSGRVRAVFQGHSHKNDYREIEGIHYCTLVAMVEGSGAENNGYSTLELLGDGTIRLAGFRRQESYTWPGRSSS